MYCKYKCYELYVGICMFLWLIQVDSLLLELNVPLYAVMCYPQYYIYIFIYILYMLLLLLYLLLHLNSFTFMYNCYQIKSIYPRYILGFGQSLWVLPGRSHNTPACFLFRQQVELCLHLSLCHRTLHLRYNWFCFRISKRHN